MAWAGAFSLAGRGSVGPTAAQPIRAMQSGVFSQGAVESGFAAEAIAPISSQSGMGGAACVGDAASMRGSGAACAIV